MRGGRLLLAYGSVLTPLLALQHQHDTELRNIHRHSGCSHAPHGIQVRSTGRARPAPHPAAPGFAHPYTGTQLFAEAFAGSTSVELATRSLWQSLGACACTRD